MNKLYLFLFFVSLYPKSFGQTLPTGTMVVCVGSTTTLHDATPGGYWISGAPSVATIDSLTGMVTGISAGTAPINYRTSSWVVAATITVNPMPTLSSPLTSTICDSSIFNYTPMSSTVGTTFAWSRAAVGGIVLPPSSGTGNPNEQLINTTPAPNPVVYVYTLTAGSCTNTENVTVTVNPHPVLSSTLTPSPICDSALFSYTPTSLTPGATFAWNRPTVAGITPTTNFGTGNISEYLDNTTSSSVVVTYYFRLSIGACINLYPETVQVTVGTCHVGINDLAKSQYELHIYPNPAEGTFMVDLPDGNVTIRVSDAAGRIVLNRIVNSGAARMQSFNEQLPAGVYLVRVVSGDFIATQKLVIQ